MRMHCLVPRKMTFTAFYVLIMMYGHILTEGSRCPFYSTSEEMVYYTSCTMRIKAFLCELEDKGRCEQMHDQSNGIHCHLAKNKTFLANMNKKTWNAAENWCSGIDASLVNVQSESTRIHITQWAYPLLGRNTREFWVKMSGSQSAMTTDAVSEYASRQTKETVISPNSLIYPTVVDTSTKTAVVETGPISSELNPFETSDKTKSKIITLSIVLAFLSLLIGITSLTGTILFSCRLKGLKKWNTDLPQWKKPKTPSPDKIGNSELEEPCVKYKSNDNILEQTSVETELVQWTSNDRDEELIKMRVAIAISLLSVCNRQPVEVLCKDCPYQLCVICMVNLASSSAYVYHRGECKELTNVCSYCKSRVKKMSATNKWITCAIFPVTYQLERQILRYWYSPFCASMWTIATNQGRSWPGWFPSISDPAYQKKTLTLNYFHIGAFQRNPLINQCLRIGLEDQGISWLGCSPFHNGPPYKLTRTLHYYPFIARARMRTVNLGKTLRSHNLFYSNRAYQKELWIEDYYHFSASTLMGEKSALSYDSICSDAIYKRTTQMLDLSPFCVPVSLRTMIQGKQLLNIFLPCSDPVYQKKKLKLNFSPFNAPMVKTMKNLGKSFQHLNLLCSNRVYKKNTKTLDHYPFSAPMFITAMNLGKYLSSVFQLYHDPLV